MIRESERPGTVHGVCHMHTDTFLVRSHMDSVEQNKRIKYFIEKNFKINYPISSESEISPIGLINMRELGILSSQGGLRGHKI